MIDLLVVLGALTAYAFCLYRARVESVEARDEVPKSETASAEPRQSSPNLMNASNPLWSSEAAGKRLGVDDFHASFAEAQRRAEEAMALASQALHASSFNQKSTHYWVRHFDDFVAASMPESFESDWQQSRQILRDSLKRPHKSYEPRRYVKRLREHRSSRETGRVHNLELGDHHE